MCSQYWPAAGEKKQCGKYLTVELVEERPYVDYVHRDFKITFTDDVVSSANTAGQQLQVHSLVTNKTIIHTICSLLFQNYVLLRCTLTCTPLPHAFTHSPPSCSHTHCPPSCSHTLPSLMLTHTLPSLTPPAAACQRVPERQSVPLPCLAGARSASDRRRHD